jgi:hypothetical protein
MLNAPFQLLARPVRAVETIATSIMFVFLANQDMDPRLRVACAGMTAGGLLAQPSSRHMDPRLRVAFAGMTAGGLLAQSSSRHMDPRLRGDDGRRAARAVPLAVN